MNNLIHWLPGALVVKSVPLLKSLRKAASVSALALTGTLLAAPAQAQWLTLDVAALTQAVTQYSAQTAEYAAQAERWSETLAQYQQQIAHYQQMIASVSGIDFSGMTISNNLARISNPSGFAARACPGSGGLVDSALGAMGLSVPDLNGNIAQSQQQICQRISLLQVDNYNQTVDLLNQMNKYGDLRGSRRAELPIQASCGRADDGGIQYVDRAKHARLARHHATAFRPEPPAHAATRVAAGPGRSSAEPLMTKAKWITATFLLAVTNEGVRSDIQFVHLFGEDRFTATDNQVSGKRPMGAPHSKV